MTYAEIAAKYRVPEPTVLLLAGIGVTHEYVPRKGEHPGTYGAPHAQRTPQRKASNGFDLWEDWQ